MRRLALPLLLGALVVTGCSEGGTSGTTPAPSTSPSPSSSASGTTESPEPPPTPARGACYDLTLDEALAATSDVEASSCSSRHTARTFLVGAVDAVVDGHLLAVDSDRVREQVAKDCPAALPGFLGGDTDDLRLSVLRPVWFTPSLAESDAGADWFRCDVVAVGGDRGLSPLRGRLQGVLASPTGRDRWGLCATGAPDAQDSQRVPCSAPHSWRAVEVVSLGSGDYPGEDRASRAGQQRCEEVGRQRAEDPLEFEWGYEWPTAEQWTAGQTFGRCWVPDPS